MAPIRPLPRGRASVHLVAGVVYQSFNDCDDAILDKASKQNRNIMSLIVFNVYDFRCETSPPSPSPKERGTFRYYDDHWFDNAHVSNHLPSFIHFLITSLFDIPARTYRTVRAGVIRYSHPNVLFGTGGRYSILDIPCLPAGRDIS
jgi:hypothetical protein